MRSIVGPRGRVATVTLTLVSASLLAGGAVGTQAGTSSCDITLVRTGASFSLYSTAVQKARDGDTLRFEGTCQTTAGASLREDLTFRGIGDDPTLVAAPGSRVLLIDGARVTIRGLTIRGGVDVNFGSGIWMSNGARVTLRDSTVTDNLTGPSDSAATLGGGLYIGCNEGQMDSHLTILSSTIHGNVVQTEGPLSTAYGAGLHIGSCGVVTIKNSTFADNEARSPQGTAAGGAISVISGTLSVIHSTLARNRVTNLGESGSSVRAQGGGIYSSNGDITVQGSIIALNTAEEGKACYVIGGAITSDGSNLINIKAKCAGFTDGVKRDQVGTNADPVKPLLRALADNGGPTLTLALQPASPAVDGGVRGPCPVGKDQRNVTRPQGGRCDIGAFEREP